MLRLEICYQLQLHRQREVIGVSKHGSKRSVHYRRIRDEDHNGRGGNKIQEAAGEAITGAQVWRKQEDDGGSRQREHS